MTCSLSTFTLEIALKRRWNVKTLLKQYASILCSLLIVGRNVSVWCLLFQMTGHYEMQMKKPVQLLTQVGYCLSSFGHNPEKSVLQRTSISNSTDGLRIRPPSNAPFRYWHMRSSVISWDIVLVSVQNKHTRSWKRWYKGVNALVDIEAYQWHWHICRCCLGDNHPRYWTRVQWFLE